MSMNVGKKVAVSLGAVCSIAATQALAAEWTEPQRLRRITVRADRAITVVNDPQAWPNPDGCDNASKVVLLPPGAVGAVESYEEIYALLLSANANNKRVIVFLDGCALSGSETFPRLTEVAVMAS